MANLNKIEPHEVPLNWKGDQPFVSVLTRLINQGFACLLPVSLRFSRAPVGIIVAIGILLSLPMLAYTQPGKEALVVNRKALNFLADSLQADFWPNYTSARKQALKMGVETDFVTSDGVRYSLQRMHNETPYYYRTFNRGGAFTSGIQKLYPFGELRLYLSGKGVTGAIWDGGRVYEAHQEFGDRVVLMNQDADNDSHATHVAGSMVAAGENANARGMAFAGGLLSFDWQNDLSEMAAQAADGLLVSNHSYGISLGWERINGDWRWMGAPSADEDYRFGFYSNLSRTLDRITYEAPHYLVVWAAGNDRTDVGDNTRPPDGPYDSIGPEGVAKNVLTVGAVNGILGGYSQPSDVVMTAFSSWGPTDDGRIKPDIVAKGQQVFSTDVNNGYSVKSGTSMAAPIVSGTMMVIQELYHHLSGGDYLRSASLKGLAIHTANPVNNAFRPDYRHGWGLLNGEKMAGFLLHQQEPTLFFREDELINGEAYEYSFYADGEAPLMATLSWTDPPGTPVPAQLNPRDIMLVNDLDVRLVHESGATFSPYILDVNRPEAAATTGDNNKDNVEKIYVEQPPAGNYRLVISHKDQLREGRQPYSVFLQIGDIPTRKSLYWIGGDGEWDDPQNWSLQSGGTPAGLVPGQDDHVIIDRQSFPIADQVLSLEGDAYCYSLTVRGVASGHLEFDKGRLMITSSLFVERPLSGPRLSGQIIFHGDRKDGVLWMEPEQIEEQEPDAARAEDLGGLALQLIFDNEEGTWYIPKSLYADQVTLRQGRVIFPDVHANIRQLVLEQNENASFMDMGQSHIEGLEKVLIKANAESLSAVDAAWTFNAQLPHGDMASLSSEGVTVGTIENQHGLEVMGPLKVSRFDSYAPLHLHDNCSITSLSFSPQADFFFHETAVLYIGEEFAGEGTTDRLVTFEGLGTSNAIAGRDNKSYCSDYLRVVNLPVEGPVVFNAGENSIITNSPGWTNLSCDQLLVADFSVEYPCRDSWTFFTDLSSGDIEQWTWQFDSLGSSTSPSPVFTFRNTGNYTVQLTISSDNHTNTTEKTIHIKDNPLPRANIVTSGNIYFVDVAARSYQWYRNGELIPGAVSQSYNNLANEEGVFTVLISNNEGCNRPASNQIVVGIDEQKPTVQPLMIYPNPASNSVRISSAVTMEHIRVYDLSGRIMQIATLVDSLYDLDIRSLSPGIYVLQIMMQGGDSVERLLQVTQHK